MVMSPQCLQLQEEAEDENRCSIISWQSVITTPDPTHKDSTIAPERENYIVVKLGKTN